MKWGVAIVLGGALAAACGGAVTMDDGSGGAAGAGQGSGGSGGGTGGGGGIPSKDAGKEADAASDREPDRYDDPGCPDVLPPPVSWECDPFAALNECPPGEGCYPFVDEPGGTGCGQEQYGTICAPVGTARQGDPCGAMGNCAAGYLCVKGAQPGTSCVKLCDPLGPNTCPSGLLCGQVDVEGIGGCY
jgi:hypothetical protein